MPMLPNTGDIDSKAVNPESNVLPDADGINVIEKQVEAPNFVEKKADFLPSIAPPSDFVSKRLDQFGEETYNNRTIDVEFEAHLANKEKTLTRKARDTQIEADKSRFMQMSDSILNNQKEEVSAIESTRKQALYGIADFAQEAVDSAASFKNAARSFFNMSELQNIPDLTSNLPEPKNNQERFVRSATKFMTGMVPISGALKTITGVAGVANSVASSGIYGFLFDDSQTEGLVNTFVKENLDLAPDTLKYLNHQIDDNEFVTRLKNSANYMVDDVAFEGIFYGLKMARNLSKGREGAYKILENGDVQVKSKKVGESELFAKPELLSDDLNRFEQKSSFAFGDRITGDEWGIAADFSGLDFDAVIRDEARNNHWVRKAFDKAGLEVEKRYTKVFKESQDSVKKLLENKTRDGEIFRTSGGQKGTLVGGAIQNRLYTDVFKEIINKTLPIKVGPKTKKYITELVESDAQYLSNMVKYFPTKNAKESDDVLEYLSELNTASAKEAPKGGWQEAITGYSEGVYKILKKEMPEEKDTSLMGMASDFVRKVVKNDFEIKGLTTEDISKKSTKDIVEEELNAVRADIQVKYDEKQAANPDRMTQGRGEALREIAKNPMSIKQLLAIKENEPVNNLITMQAEMAQEALTRVSDNIMKGVIEGRQDPEIAIYKLINIAEAVEKLSFPRSTSGRSLEAAKFVSDLGDLDPLDKELLIKLRAIHGRDAARIFDEYRLVKENLTGFPIADATLNAMRKNIDLDKVWKTLSSARINWILSDPTIHGANITSNTTTMGLRVATEVTASAIGKSRGVFGNRFLQRGSQFNESRATVQGYYGGMMKGFSIIADNISTFNAKSEKKEVSVPTKNGGVKTKTLIKDKVYKSIYSRDSNTKYNTAMDKIINDSEIANNFGEGTLGKKIATVLGHVVIGTPVGKMLSWEDDFFKGMHYMAEVNKQLTIKENAIATNTATIEDPKEALDYATTQLEVINKIRENFKNGVIDKDIDKAARDAANYWTFNSELVGEDVVTKALSAGENFINNMPGLKWFIPFYRTGANIANMSLEYTPVIGGIIKMGNAGGVAGLMRGGRNQDALIAKQTIGTAIFASAAIAYSMFEDIFGTDFKMSSIKNNKVGLKIGEVETTIDKQTPIFKIFAATKDIMDIANIAGQTEGAEAAVAAASALLMEMYSPEQMIQLLGTISDVANAKSELDSKLVNMLKMNVLSQVSPYSGTARFIQRDIVGMNKVVHGQERNEDLLDEMMKRIKHTYLGDDAEIPVRRGLFGQEIPYLRTMGYTVSDNAHDMFAGYDLDDPTIKEVLNLTREEVMSNPENYTEYKLNQTTMLSMPSRTIALPTGEAYELTPKEYSDYVQFSAGEHPSFKGKTLKYTLDKLVQSQQYKSLKPAQKTTAIKDVVGLYRKAAKGILLNDHVDIMIEGKESLMRLKREYNNGE